MALLALFTVGIVVVFIKSGFRIHMDELQWHMGKNELLGGNLNHVHLIAKLESQRKLYLNEITHQQMDEAEFEMSRLLNTSNLNLSSIDPFHLVDQVSFAVINGLRRSLGKQILPSADELELYQMVLEAFRLEQRKNYGEALHLYNQILQRTTDPRLRGIVLLHQGFCLALLHQDQPAMQKYQEVIQKHADEDLGVVASLLLQHLKSVIYEEQLLQERNITAMARARKLTHLLRCETALPLLDSLEKIKGGPPGEIHYLRGYCLEESGQRKVAAQSYIRAIKVSGKSELAQDANRRLFLIGDQLEGGETLKKASLEMNQVLQDTALTKLHVVDSLLRPDTTVSTTPDTNVLAVTGNQLNYADTLKILGPDTVTNQVTIEMEILLRTADSLRATTSLIAAAVAAANQTPAVSPQIKQRPTVPVEKTTNWSRLVLKSGKVLNGEVISSPSASILRIKTIFGVIGVPREEVVSGLN